MGMNDPDETAQVSITRRVALEQADAFILGWRNMIMEEIDQMRRELPYADYLDLRLVSERRQ